MSQNSSVQIPFLCSHYSKYDKSKSSAKYHKLLMSRFWEIVCFVPLLFLPPCLFCVILNPRPQASYCWPPVKLSSATYEIQTMFSQLAKRSARFLQADLCTDHAHYVKNHKSTVMRTNKSMAVEGTLTIIFW